MRKAREVDRWTDWTRTEDLEKDLQIIMDEEKNRRTSRSPSNTPTLFILCPDFPGLPSLSHTHIPTTGAAELSPPGQTGNEDKVVSMLRSSYLCWRRHAA